jgi:hypothetical protein
VLSFKRGLQAAAVWVELSVALSEDFNQPCFDRELAKLLRLWTIPARPPSMDRRISKSFLSLNNHKLRFASPHTRSTPMEVSMKRCIACDDYPAPAPYEFNLTLISSAGLGRSLAAEVLFLSHQFRGAWPNFKRRPIGFVLDLANDAASYLKRIALAPNAIAGALTAGLLLFTALLSLVLLENLRGPKPKPSGVEEAVPVVMLNFPNAPPPPEAGGVGVGSYGRVGLARGKGEGSESEPQRARGGGGSGDHDPLPASVGKVPPPSEIPAPLNPPLPQPALPVAGVDLDPALWANLPFPKYGDPRSKATTVRGRAWELAKARAMASDRGKMATPAAITGGEAAAVSEDRNPEMTPVTLSESSGLLKLPAPRFSPNPSRNTRKRREGIWSRGRSCLGSSFPNRAQS